MIEREKEGEKERVSLPRPLIKQLSVVGNAGPHLLSCPIDMWETFVTSAPETYRPMTFRHGGAVAGFPPET